MTVDLIDARQSPTDRDWLAHVYSPAIAFWRAILDEYAGRRYEETTTHEVVRQIFDSRHRVAR